MSRFLIVAHQTALSAELAEAVRSVARSEPAAEFALLVPATPVTRLLTWEEGETLDIARRAAAAGRERLRALGVAVVETLVGDASPLLAVRDEMQRRPGYNAIIVGTLPAGVSGWLRLDLPRRLRAEFAVPVIHVVAREPSPAPA